MLPVFYNESDYVERSMILNTIVTSKEAILDASRELIRTQGWTAINIRSVAKSCNISVGSIYNYFHNKTDLITATIESIWQDIFHMPEEELAFQSFIQSVEWAFDRFQNGDKKYPDFFSMHSMSFMGEDKKHGQERMAASLQHIQESFYQVLIHDPNVKKGLFNEDFTERKFISMVLSMILSSLSTKTYDRHDIVYMLQLFLYR